MEFESSKKHIERAADLIFRAGKLAKKNLPNPEKVANNFVDNLQDFQNSKRINELFDRNAKAILDKIQQNKKARHR